MWHLGAQYHNMTGVIEGNFVSISSPMGLGNSVFHYNQKDFYNGKEKAHGIKYLVGLNPYGMMSLWGPVPGSVHDSEMLSRSNWLPMLSKVSRAGSSFLAMLGSHSTTTST